MITVGNSVMGLYNLKHLVYTRYMATNEEHVSFSVMDNLVMEAQNVAHLYVQAYDANPEASVDTEADREHVARLCKALAGFVLASDVALRFVALYASGGYSVTDGDF